MPPTYDRYPAVDENLELPPTVMQPNQAIALTTAARDALVAARKWDGRQIYNTTLKRYERWDATAGLWRTLADQQDLSTLLITSGTPADLAATANRGVSNFAARGDHVHAVPAGVDYTPSFNFTLGTGGTRTGRYTLLGKLCYFWARIKLGTGFNLGGGPELGVPFTARTNTGLGLTLSGNFLDVGAANYSATVFMPSSANSVSLWVPAGNGGFAAVSYTAPFTWVAGDELVASGFYEIA